MSFPFPKPFPGPSATVGVSNIGSVLLLGDELDGFTIDFSDNSTSVRTTSASEKLLLQLGNEWNGMALDFTSDLYVTRRTGGGEMLLGQGPDTIENAAMGVDFTDNTFALRS